MKFSLNGKVLEASGKQGDPGQGVPLGGTTGQLLAKITNDDYNTHWVDGWSNPNLLDNWYFADPINQRGQTEYVSSRTQQYTIDRWISAGDNTPTWGLYVVEGGIKLLKGSAFQQKLEKGFSSGTVVTFSALIDGVLYSITFSWDSSSGYYAIPQLNGFALAWNGVNGYTQIYNQNGTGAEIVQAAKLELGPVQTLAHQDADGSWVLNDPPPNKALELAKCQRYHQMFFSENLRPAKAVDFRPPMRANPALGTIEINGVTYYTADANL